MTRSDPRTRAVIVKYARLTRNGSPMRCTPSRRELNGTVLRRMPPGNDGKVIYDTREQALACAKELREQLGSQRQTPYICDRSRSSHYHLTTDRSRGVKPERTKS